MPSLQPEVCRRLRLALLAVLCLLPGCAEFGYYLQSVDGQLQVNAARRPVAAVIGDAATPEPLRQRLQRAVEIRDFASRELHLPDNGSYRSYADLGRPFVVWNVFAAAEFSVEPQRWCFLFAGCVGYRGYFSRSEADRHAQSLRGEGFEVYVAGVRAYSTLGWFDDPLLNTFIHAPEHELARLVFHELAHQVAYARDDTEFNESFAVAVETEGVDRWIAQQGSAALRTDVAQARSRRLMFSALVEDTRQRLAMLYREPLAPEIMRARKAAMYAELRAGYAALKSQWDGFAGYDAFFEHANNAHLASFGLYHAWLPALQRLLARGDGDLATFYAAVRELAKLPRGEREAALAAP